MNRLFMQKLIEWQDRPQRKPMLIQGARQVGKTWLLKQFGKSRFTHCIHLDFAENKELNGFFEPNLRPEHQGKEHAGLPPEVHAGNGDPALRARFKPAG